MFKKFMKEDISNQSQAKSSVARGVRNKIQERYPSLRDHLETIIPKKEPMQLAKCPGHIQLVIINNEVVFYQERDGPLVPTLRLLHKYPGMMGDNVVQVDRGAVRFVMQGANIMCPGMTSKGGHVEDEVPEGAIVAVMVEGKTLPVAIGLTKMSGKEIKETNAGIGVDNIHYLNDGLWRLKL